MPGMNAFVKEPKNPYYQFTGIVQRVTDGKVCPAQSMFREFAVFIDVSGVTEMVENVLGFPLLYLVNCKSL